MNRGQRKKHPRRTRPHLAPEFRRAGFTLLELLVVTAIIAVVLSVVLAALGKVRATSKCVVCMNNLKTVGYEFFHFASEFAHSYRGDSERTAGNAFRLEDFQEKLYGIHEFWDAGDVNDRSLERTRHPLVCPAGGTSLRKRKNVPCNQYAVTPAEGVSIGFNMRLEQVSLQQNGWWRLPRTRLTPRILDRPEVPLVFGVDGATAVAKGVLPYYSAPPVEDAGLYGNGRFWFPSVRHDGKLNVAFVGGHVLRAAGSDNPKSAAWKYQPPLR